MEDDHCSAGIPEDVQHDDSESSADQALQTNTEENNSEVAQDSSRYSREPISCDIL